MMILYLWYIAIRINLLYRYARENIWKELALVRSLIAERCLLNRNHEDFSTLVPWLWEGVCIMTDNILYSKAQSTGMKKLLTKSRHQLRLFAHKSIIYLDEHLQMAPSKLVLKYPKPIGLRCFERDTLENFK